MSRNFRKFVSICVISSLSYIILVQDCSAGWLKDRLKDVGNIVREVPKVIVPIQPGIDIVRGKSTPGQAIKDLVQGQGRSIGSIVESTRNITSSVDQGFERAAGAIGGDFGKVIYQVSTVSGRIQREFSFTAVSTAGAVLQGKDPLIVVAMPLAAALRDARNSYINSAKPLPQEVITLFFTCHPSKCFESCAVCSW